MVDLVNHEARTITVLSCLLFVCNSHVLCQISKRYDLCLSVQGFQSLFCFHLCTCCMSSAFPAEIPAELVNTQTAFVTNRRTTDNCIFHNTSFPSNNLFITVDSIGIKPSILPNMVLQCSISQEEWGFPNLLVQVSPSKSAGVRSPTGPFQNHQDSLQYPLSNMPA